MSKQDPTRATQLEFFTVPSPCIGVCESGPRGFCKGCFRSREERLYWLNVDDATRREIVAACYRRKMQARRRQLKNDAPARSDAPRQADLFDNGSDN